jgi:hypothetical protein
MSLGRFEIKKKRKENEEENTRPYIKKEEKLSNVSLFSFLRKIN